jgi:hypothetical protein
MSIIQELTDRYVEQEFVGRIVLLIGGVAVRIDTIVMIDVCQLKLTSWMTIFLR